MDFIAKFATSLIKSEKSEKKEDDTASESESDDEEMNPFIVKLFDYCLQVNIEVFLENLFIL